MVTAILTAAAFAVTAFSPDHGYAITRGALCIDSASTMNGSLLNESVSMSTDGSVVSFVETRVSATACGNDQIVVIDKGRRRVVPRPDAAQESTTAEYFYVSRLRVSDDGSTLFATLTDRFSGAYIGAHEHSFVWAHDRWTKLQPPASLVSDDDKGNVSVGAAASARFYALNKDYDNRQLVTPDVLENPAFAAQAALVAEGGTTLLGAGTVEALSGQRAAGYRDAAKHITPPMAILWTRGNRSVLGTGVGFGVNDLGDVAGDDRASWMAPGHPVVWHANVMHRLSAETGSAFAIRDSVIAGKVGNEAFVTSLAASGTVRRLDRFVGSRWRVSSAFGISTTGAILAIGQKPPGRKRCCCLRAFEISAPHA